MAYQALYRKYRSQRFDEMVGQEVVATTLKNAIINNQISHAYLFSGPRGTGKTSAAKIFAKAINCPNAVDGEPDNTCDICKAITAGNLEDVIELDAASNNGVDDIREIRDKSTYAASLARYKVYIIDEVHMLSTGAFNALLKTLEEPTPGVVFILATTELQKIPATIISRVQRFAFKSISTTDIKEHLAEVLADENLEYEDKALDIIARSAEGGMRDALSLLDQALSFSENKLQESDALLVTGAISDAALLDYVKALQENEMKTALATLDQIFAEGKNMMRFAEDLLAYFRDQLFDENSTFEHVLLYRWIEVVIDALKTLRETTQTKIAADVMTMQLLDVGQGRAIAGVTGVNSVAAPISHSSQPVNNTSVSVSTTEVSSHSYPSSRAPHFQAEYSPIPESTSSNEEVVSEKLATPVAVKARSQRKQINITQDLIFSILEEAIAEPEVIQQVRPVWIEAVSSLSSPKNIALLKASQIAASSSKHLLLTVGQESLAKIISTDDSLLDEIQEKLSLLTGLSPKVLVLTEDAWLNYRAAYTAQRKADKLSSSTEDEARAESAAAEVLGVTEAEEAPEEKVDEAELAKSLFGDKAVIIDN